MSEEENDYVKYLTLFYTMKKNFDEQKKSLKKKIVEKASSKKEARDKLKLMMPNCINCGKKGGTNFVINTDYLMAYCNAPDKCNLSIKIKKGKILDYNYVKESIKLHLETLKSDIIKNKLNLLFNLENEDIIINEFKSLKEEYKEFSEKLKSVNLYKDKLDKTKWGNYMEFYNEKKDDIKNETKEDETKFKTEMKKREETVKKSELIHLINKRLDDDVKNIKQLLKEARELSDKKKIRKAIDVYIQQILPNITKKSELEFSEIFIESNQISSAAFGKTPEYEYILNKNQYSLNDLDLIIEKFELIEKNLNQKNIGKTLSMKKRSKKSRMITASKQGATLTFSSSVENHHGMVIHGEKSEGYTIMDLKNTEKKIKELYPRAEVKIYDLRTVLPEEQKNNAEPAAILIFKEGVNYLLSSMKKNSIDLFNEHRDLKKDEKYKDKRRNKVLNKKARHNLCFADESQKADFEKGLGTIVPFSILPITRKLREALPKIIGEKAKNKKAEGNYYYNLNETGIGFHGDSERADVIGIRFGEDDESGFPLHYQWYYQGEPIGDRYKFDLKNGDLYIMSEKAVGQDWKKRKILTLRHAAGADKYLKIDKVDPEIIKLIGKNKIDETINIDNTEEEGDLLEEMTDTKQERPDLYNNDSVFVFYSKSRDVLPGKGGNKHKDESKRWSEKVSDPSKFDELSRIKNWRKVLSNMWGGLSENEDKPLFNLDGYEWASVEHWFHANKFKWKMEENAEYKDFYEKFTFNSGSEICKDAKFALGAGGRTGRVKGKQYRPKNVVLDPNWEKIKEKIMAQGQRAKYMQDTLSKKVLLATKDAKLVHLVTRRGKGSVLVNFNSTMEIRESLKNTTGFRKIVLEEPKDDLQLDEDLQINDDPDDVFDDTNLYKPISFNGKIELNDEDISDEDVINYERR